MRAETLKGHLDGMLLAALEAEPRHGYAIMEALRAGSGGQFDLPTGTVYPALHRLERAGLVQASWSVHGGRRRRLYQLTPDGRRALDSERRTWRDFSSAVTALLRPASPAASTP
jgi:DNA-binding PadR family transcriptional regulator